MKLLTICNIYDFDYLSPPSLKLVISALEQLYNISAIDSRGNLTRNIGKIMCKIPLIPHLAKCLLASCALGCVDNMLTICSLLTTQNLLGKYRIDQYKFKKIKRQFS